MGGGVLHQEISCLNGVVLDKINIEMPLHKTQGLEVFVRNLKGEM